MLEPGKLAKLILLIRHHIVDIVYYSLMVPTAMFTTFMFLFMMMTTFNLCIII